MKLSDSATGVFIIPNASVGVGVVTLRMPMLEPVGSQMVDLESVSEWIIFFTAGLESDFYSPDYPPCASFLITKGLALLCKVCFYGK